MLHHDYRRTQSSLSLMLSYAPLGLIRATKLLVSLDSICVDTGCIALNDHSEVEIVLSVHHNAQTHTYRIPATVSGRDEHGLRLQFKECAGETAEALLPFVTDQGQFPGRRRPG